MEQAVETPGSAATDPAGAAAVREPALAGPIGLVADADAEESGSEDAAAEGRRRPDWWHRDHPVFVPLAGFFTGMSFIILVPGSYGAILKELVGYERAEELFPFVLLTMVVPISLLVPRGTRKFGRYMLFGVVATAVVVIGVALAVLWFLVNRDR